MCRVPLSSVVCHVVARLEQSIKYNVGEEDDLNGTN
jgi:hypothetical protein